MTENEAFIYESIFNQVRMGFLPLDEIKDNISEEIDDNGFSEEVTEEWAFLTIEKEFNKLSLESENWIKPTDTEKLIKAFDELIGENIIALHNAGYTTSDGEDDVVEVERHLRDYEAMSDGYCFYHGQDLERAISPTDSNLYLSFQKINNSKDVVTIAVGNKIVEVLLKHGFKVVWDQTPTSKILIENFRWNYFYDVNHRDIKDEEETVKRLSKNKKGKINYDKLINDNNNSGFKTKLWSWLKGLKV